MTKPRIPSYRLHKATGQAVVVLHGQSHYLGKYGTPESRAKYDHHIARYLVHRQEVDRTSSPLSRSPTPGKMISVNDLVLRYWRFAKEYYVKNGRPTGEQHPIKTALRILRRLYGDTLAAEFGPQALKSVRDAMVVQPITRKVKVKDPESQRTHFEDKVIRVGWTRRTVNKQVGRIKRVFAWAVAEELIHAEVHGALTRLDGLRKGRSSAHEKARVCAVPVEHVQTVMSRVQPVIAAMIEVQLLTGCRPHEIVFMKATEIDRTEPIWEYRPRVYKTEHTNVDEEPDHDRVIFLGPRAQSILAPYLAMARGGYLFQPKRIERRHDHLASDTKPSPIGTKATLSGKSAEPRYTVASYRQAIQRACRRADISVWFPLQLRHTAATLIRKRFGLERAQAVLGHRELGVTQVYAEVDREAARAVMAELG